MHTGKNVKCVYVILGLAMLSAAGCGGARLDLLPSVTIMEDVQGEKITLYKGAYSIELDQTPSDIVEIAWNAINQSKKRWNNQFIAGKIDQPAYQAKIALIDKLAEQVAKTLGRRKGWFSGRTPEQRAEAEARLIIEIFDKLKQIDSSSAPGDARS